MPAHKEMTFKSIGSYGSVCVIARSLSTCVHHLAVGSQAERSSWMVRENLQLGYRFVFSLDLGNTVGIVVRTQKEMSAPNLCGDGGLAFCFPVLEGRSY